MGDQGSFWDYRSQAAAREKQKKSFLRGFAARRKLRKKPDHCNG